MVPAPVDCCQGLKNKDLKCFAQCLAYTSVMLHLRWLTTRPSQGGGRKQQSARGGGMDGEWRLQLGGLPSCAVQGHLGFLIRIPPFLRRVLRLGHSIFCSGVRDGQGRAQPLQTVSEDVCEAHMAYHSGYWGSPKEAG